MEMFVIISIITACSLFWLWVAINIAIFITKFCLIIKANKNINKRHKEFKRLKKENFTPTENYKFDDKEIEKSVEFVFEKMKKTLERLGDD